MCRVKCEFRVYCLRSVCSLVMCVFVCGVYCVSVCLQVCWLMCAYQCAYSGILCVICMIHRVVLFTSSTCVLLACIASVYCRCVVLVCGVWRGCVACGVWCESCLWEVLHRRVAGREYVELDFDVHVCETRASYYLS